MSYIKTGDIENKISPQSLNNGTVRKCWKMGQLNKIWKFLRFGIFEIRVQRRGARVNILKIGSRDGQKCFGGILGFYAELRRELIWGNWDWGFFGVLVVSPRRLVEEGGPMVCLGECFCCLLEVLWDLTAASKAFATVCCSLKVRGTAKNIEVMVRYLKG
jgi:hypothetical protein